MSKWVAPEVAHGRNGPYYAPEMPETACFAALRQDS